MKIPALTATMLAAAMVTTPASANESSRFDENKTVREPVQVHHLKQKKIRHQYYLPERVIKRTLRHRGYQNVNIVRFRDGYYIVRANGYRGLVRLQVDARTGAVVRRDLIQPYPTYSHKKPGIYFHWRVH
ncbi:MAG: hypothetical protein AAFY99_14985 [Pseudomonadota bacterium]